MVETTQEDLWIQDDAGDALMRERYVQKTGFDDRTPRERREDREAVERWKSSR